MSVFSQAMNGFRSTATRAGKFYESTAATRGRYISAAKAYAPRIKGYSRAIEAQAVAGTRQYAGAAARYAQANPRAAMGIAAGGVLGVGAAGYAMGARGRRKY